MISRGVAVLALLAACALAQYHPITTYVMLNGGNYSVSSTGGPMAVATVSHQPSMQYIGWDVINITTNPSFNDWQQAYAAGFGEGAATYASSWNNWINLYAMGANGTMSSQPIAPQVATFVMQNWAWIRQQVAALNATSDYWYQVGLQAQQFDGMLAGLNSVAPANQTFSFMMLNYLNLNGDLEDLIPALVPNAVPDWRRMKKRDFEQWATMRSHCSVLVKLAADGSDIFFGHDTWAGYNTMLRLYKHFTLNYHRASPSKQVSYSGYPGMMPSTDDFYITDTGLGITETSLNIYNLSLYADYVQPQTVLYWMRVMVTTRMATSAAQWVQIFAEYNSGTYNNQWVVLDFNLFTPGMPLLPQTLMIAEQIPGTVAIQDVTNILAYGYWPSYNVPSIPAIFVEAGYPEAVASQGPEMNSYQNNVRGEIFRRDQGNVNNLPSFTTVMQYNNYLHDPISQDNPVYAIASRMDLAPQPQCFGAIDTKVISWQMQQAGRQVLAYSGPTLQQPAFDYTLVSPAAQDCAHLGQPLRWSFEWQHFSPLA